VRGILGKVFRASDAFAVDDIRVANSLVEYDKAVDETLSVLEQKIVSETDPVVDPLEDLHTNTIGGALENLTTALSGFENDPTNMERKEAVRTAAQKLVDAVKRANDCVVESENRLKAKVEDSVTEVNKLLETIGKLTKDIARNGSGGRRLFDLEDQWDKAVRDLSTYLPVEVEHRVAQVNGLETRTREVLIKAEHGLVPGDIPVGGANNQLVRENRLLVNKNGETMTFFVEHDQPNELRVEALAIGQQDAAGGTNRIGYDAQQPPQRTAFSCYLKRNSAFGGTLPADLNLLEGGVRTQGDSSANFKTLPEFKRLLNELVGGVVPVGGAQVGGLVGVFNAANGGVGFALFAGNDVATFALAPGWLGDAGVLEATHAAAVVGCVADQTAIRFGGAAGREMRFIDFYNHLAAGLGRDIHGAKTGQKANGADLKTAMDRRDETAAVDLSDEVQAMQQLDTLFRFVLDARRLVLEQLRLCGALMATA
jgi:hypothetical protein